MGLVSTAALGIPGGMRSFLVPATLSLRGTAFAEDAVAIALVVVLTR